MTSRVLSHERYLRLPHAHTVVTMSAQPPPPPASTVPSVLLPELLGFVPQFLLDDIVDTANDAVKQAVDAMEQFLERWATARREKNVEWDSTQEIEQGLVAFQTLLNTHVDIAFDFFETWSLRNIFAVPPELPLVAPHQEGLKMDWTAQEEEGLEKEIKELRRKIHAVCAIPSCSCISGLSTDHLVLIGMFPSHAAHICGFETILLATQTRPPTYTLRPNLLPPSHQCRTAPYYPHLLPAHTASSNSPLSPRQLPGDVRHRHILTPLIRARGNRRAAGAQRRCGVANDAGAW